MLQRTRTVNGVEGVATSEYFNALRAMNFISTYSMSWSIKLSEVDYDLELMIEHAKEIVNERGYQELRVTDSLAKGFIELNVTK